MSPVCDGVAALPSPRRAAAPPCWAGWSGPWSATIDAGVQGKTGTGSTVAGPSAWCRVLLPVLPGRCCDRTEADPNLRPSVAASRADESRRRQVAESQLAADHLAFDGMAGGTAPQRRNLDAILACSPLHVVRVPRPEDFSAYSPLPRPRHPSWWEPSRLVHGPEPRGQPIASRTPRESP